MALNRDVLAGAMFGVWGLLGLWLGRDLAAGSLLRMGPGYLPRALSWGLLALGVLMAARAAFGSSAAMERWRLRSLLVCLAVLMFGVLIVPAGLVAASVAVIAVGALAGSEFRLGEVLALAALLSAAAVALFVFALGLPLSPWPA